MDCPDKPGNDELQKIQTLVIAGLVPAIHFDGLERRRSSGVPNAERTHP